MEQLRIALDFFKHSSVVQWPGLALYFSGWALHRTTGLKLFEERQIHLKAFSAVGDVEGNCGLNFLHEIAIRNSYEYKDFLRGEKVSTVFDAGANCGFFTLLYLSRNRHAKAYCFEPHPVTANRLRKNIVANGLQDRMVLVEAAIGSEPGECTFQISEGSSMGTVAGSSHKLFDKAKEVKVKILSLDAFAKEAGVYPEFLKIDVEGFEVEALKGATKCLEHARFAVLEFHNDALRDQCLEILRHAGFTAEVHTTLIFAKKP